MSTSNVRLLPVKPLDDIGLVMREVRQSDYDDVVVVGIKDGIYFFHHSAMSRGEILFAAESLRSGIMEQDEEP